MIVLFKRINYLRLSSRKFLKCHFWPKFKVHNSNSYQGPEFFLYILGLLSKLSSCIIFYLLGIVWVSNDLKKTHNIVALWLQKKKSYWAWTFPESNAHVELTNSEFINTALKYLLGILIFHIYSKEHNNCYYLPVWKQRPLFVLLRKYQSLFFLPSWDDQITTQWPKLIPGQIWNLRE